MKKIGFTVVGILALLLFWVFYSQRQEQTATGSSSSQVSSASSKKPARGVGSAGASGESADSQEESVSSSQQTSAAEDKKEDKDNAKGDDQTSAASSLDMSAIASGDFSSMVGTWQDANGTAYTFDAAGIASDVANLETGQPYAGLDANGIYRAGIRWNNGPGAAFLIIPAGTSLPEGETYDGTDPTDTGQDRFIIAQSISEHPDVFYRVK